MHIIYMYASEGEGNFLFMNRKGKIKTYAPNNRLEESKEQSKQVVCIRYSDMEKKNRQNILEWFEFNYGKIWDKTDVMNNGL